MISVPKTISVMTMIAVWTAMGCSSEAGRVERDLRSILDRGLPNALAKELRTRRGECEQHPTMKGIWSAYRRAFTPDYELLIERTISGNSTYSARVTYRYEDRSRHGATLAACRQAEWKSWYGEETVTVAYEYSAGTWKEQREKVPLPESVSRE